MKYIEKTLTNGQGYDVTCWVASEGSFNVLTGMAKLKMTGWKDADAFVGKKPHADQKWVELEMSSLKSFESVWGELALKLVTGGAFENGIINDTEWSEQ